MKIQSTANTTKNTVTNLLSERLELWNQQDLAQRNGEWHRALMLETTIRDLTDQIRLAMGLHETSHGRRE